MTNFIEKINGMTAEITTIGSITKENYICHK